ncbi:MAG: hypothetical protein ACK5PF_01195 [bacterium]|jgi:hypothetical protein
MATPTEFWAHTISGMTQPAGDALADLHAQVTELHLIHGLKLGSPLTVTPTSREAGAVSQTIVTAGETVTVTRD